MSGPEVAGTLSRANPADTYPIFNANDGNGGAKTVATASALSTLINVNPGDLATAQDTKIVYQWNGSTWTVFNLSASSVTVNPGTAGVSAGSTLQNALNGPIPAHLTSIAALRAQGATNTATSFFVDGSQGGQFYANASDTTTGAVFTGLITGSVLTVTAMIGTGSIAVAQAVANGGVTPNTWISSFDSGTGGVGTYNLTNSQTVASGTMTSDEGGNIFVDLSGIRWYRIVGTGGASIANYGAIADWNGTTGTDNSGALVAAAKVNSGNGTAISANAGSPTTFSVYVPPGMYFTSIMPIQLDTFWGPGQIYFMGQQIPISLSPISKPLTYAAFSNLARTRIMNGPLAVIGDSISAHYFASVIENHWFNRIQKALNIYSAPGSEPLITDFNDNGGPPTFYGLTLSGSFSYGTAGPVGVSLILAAGASISCTGNYGFVDVFYTQQAGAGTLEWAFNGGSPYHTLSCAGATALDQFTFPVATGQTTSGTYTVTATGGPVEITGFSRLNGAAEAQGNPAICYKFAKGSQATATFIQPSVLASIQAQMTTADIGGRPTVLVALGTNDMVNPPTYATPTAMYNNMLTILQFLKTQCNALVGVIGLMRPGAGWNINPGFTFENYNGLLMEAADQMDCPFLNLDQIPFAQEGIQFDGLHPNDAGEIRYTQLVMEFLATVADFKGNKTAIPLGTISIGTGYLGIANASTILSGNREIPTGIIDNPGLGTGQIVLAPNPNGCTIDFYNSSVPNVSPTLSAQINEAGDFTPLIGNLAVGTVGKGLEIKTGAGGRAGTAALVAGTVTVACPSVTANTLIFVSYQDKLGSSALTALVTARVPGTSFSITADGDATNTSFVAYFLVEPI
jgi:hypothetical protein